MQIEKYPKAYKVLSDYMSLPIGHGGVRTTYWTNWDDKLKIRIVGPYSGKGTPIQIASTALHEAKKNNVNLASLNVSEIRSFLKSKHIGVDCSGFVYHISDALEHDLNKQSIKKYFLDFGSLLPSWRLSWRVNADHLTDAKHTRDVQLKEVRVGDLIRISNGKHVMIVVDVDGDEITYAHSSKLLARKSGVHLGKIKIINWNKDISVQKWMEESKKGKNLSKFIHIDSGDGLKRFLWR